MSRCKGWIAIVAILIIATALTAVALPQKAEAATTKSKLRGAKLALRQSKDRLKSVVAALAAAEAAQAGLGTTATDPAAAPAPSPVVTSAAVPTVDQLHARVVKARKAVRVWKQRVQKLARRFRFELNMVRWEKQHEWKKIIDVAAARYHVSADGIYRMMMRESGGQQYAGSGSGFKGLFQYCIGTWSASWNPWRSDDIYDGSSQIFATAYAIHKGMGSQMWTTTFASQY